MNPPEISVQNGEVTVKPVHIIQENSEVNCVCLIDEERFASCIIPGIIRVWSTKSYQCEGVLNERSPHKMVYVSQMSEGRLISCGEGIKIWDVGSKTCLKLIDKEKDFVCQAKEISEKKICSCYGNGKLVIYEGSSPYNEIQILKGHPYVVFSFIQLSSRKHIFSYSLPFSFSEEPETDCIIDHEIRVWNRNYQCDSVISGVGGNYLFELDESTVILGGLKGITLLDTVVFQVKQKIKLPLPNEFTLISCMTQAHNGSFLCGVDSDEAFELVKVDVKLGQANIINKKSHDDKITCLLMLSDDVLISSSFDKTIQFWEPFSNTK